MVRVRLFSVLTFLLISIAVVNAQDFQELKNSMKNSVEFLVSDSLQGRRFGSAGERDAATYIYNKLSEYGVTMLSPAGGDDFYMVKSPGDTVRSANVIGIVEGYDSELRNEYIVIGAHYDHLGTNFVSRNGKDVKQIYRGADDNASGVAVALELARIIDLNKYMFKRSVIFAFFGGKEEGMSGSWYFVNRYFKNIDSVIFMINLDMVGRSAGGNSLYAQTAIKNVELSSALDSISYRDASIIIPEITKSEHLTSDHIMFYEKGIPVVLFTSGTHKDYHSVFDTPDKLDYGQMAYLVDYVYAFAQLISDSKQKPYSINMLNVKKTGGNNEDVIYTQRDVDKSAQFLHGNEQQFLNKWVYQYLKYPRSAIAEGISGTVVVEFVVDKSGNVRDVKIVKGVSESLDNEAIKVISSSPKWKPAEYNGEKVSIKTSVPVVFKLTNKGGIKLKKW